MVSVNPQLATPSSNVTDVRSKAKQERLARIAANRPPAMIRVEPTSDDMRRVMKHPSGGKFRAEGSANWPNDKFTHRRIADGNIRRVDEGEQGEQRNRPRSRTQRSEEASS